MKAKWLLSLAVAVLASCEKPVPEITPPVATERKRPEPTKFGESPDTGTTHRPETPTDKKETAPPGLAATPQQAPAPPPPPPKPAIPEATPVEGKPGYVFSPHNGKIVDVRNMPAGTLVADPSYSPSEKKHFRVPY